MKNRIGELYRSLPLYLRGIQIAIVVVIVATAIYSWNWIVTFQKVSAEHAVLIDVTGRQRMLSQRLLVACKQFGLESDEFQGIESELLEKQKFLGEKLATKLTGEPQKNQFPITSELLSSYIAGLKNDTPQQLHWAKSMEFVKSMDQLNIYHREYINKQLRRLYILIITVLITNAVSIILEFYLIVFPIVSRLIDAREAEEERGISLRNTVNKLGKVHLQVAHDLRSPIQAALSKADMIELTIKEDTEKSILLVDQLKRQIQHINGTVSQIDNLIKGRSLAKAEIPLKLIFEKTILNMEQTVLESKALITLKSNSVVYVDSVEFIIALQNLLSNSIKYAQPGVRPLIQVDCYSKSNVDIIIIDDNGIGIDQKNLGKVFDFSFRDESVLDKADGKGIGLFTVQEIVKKHGGEVSITSKENQGTSVSITIPKR